MQVLTLSCREPRFHPPNFLIFQGTLQVCFSFKGKSPGRCYNTDTTVIDSCLRNTFCVFHPCRVWKTGRAGQKYLADVWTAAWSLQWELAGQLQPPLQRLRMTLSILTNEDNTGNFLNYVGYTCRCFKPILLFVSPRAWWATGGLVLLLPEGAQGSGVVLGPLGQAKLLHVNYMDLPCQA